MERECKHHGLTEYFQDNRGYWRCKKCRTAAVTKARQTRKKRLVEYKGGACEICGYDKCVDALDFHHRDPNEKDFSISHRGLCKSWEKQKVEVDKCIMVCSNCHREIHAGMHNMWV